MSELTAAAAAALGIPETIVERSAAARAAETGMSVDEVLSVWAGGGELPVAATTETPADSTEDSPEAPPEEQGEVTPPTPTEGVPAEEPIVPAAATQPATVTRAPVPAEVTAAEAATLPEVITVPTAGIRERTNFTIPRWLAAVMLIIPAFALFALGSSATGECGDATELETDVMTGAIVNCDGTEFTGSGAGGGGTDFIAMGEELYGGAPSCDGCHGVNGGGGVGPAFGGVVTTFGSCSDHIEWVTLGTTGFQAEGRATYGDSNKPVGGAGVMPPFGGTLSAEQLAAVAAFERVRFGGADPAETLVDCGLAEGEGEAEGEEGEGPAPAPGEEAPADGATSTTMGDAEAAMGRTP